MTSIIIQPLYEKQTRIHNKNQSLQHLPKEVGWFEEIKKNKPQFFSIGAAALVFMSGGMQMAFSPLLLSKHRTIAWFIGAIIGTAASSITRDFISKKILFLLSSSFVLIGGVLSVSLFDDITTMIAARYVDGIANGLLFPLVLILAGEESTKRLRGMLVAIIEAMSFSLGIYTYLILYSIKSLYEPSFLLPQMLGGFSIIYGIIAISVTLFFYIESPIFYLIHDNETQAIEALHRLQDPYMVSSATYEQLEEHKEYIAYNREYSITQSIGLSLPALLKLCLYRSLNALSYSNMTNNAFRTAVFTSYSSAKWTYIVMGTLRWLGVLLSACTIDSIGRKQPILIGTLTCGGMTIGIAIIFHNSLLNWLDTDRMRIVLYFIFVFQFFAGFIISSSSAYLSEAFPLNVKSFFIGFAFIVELLIQIICFTTADLLDIPIYFFATATIFFVLFICGIFKLPETKCISLLKAQKKFH